MRKKRPQKTVEIIGPKEVRRQKFVAGMVEGKSMRQAALYAGYSPSMAAQACREILPQVQGLFREALHHKISVGKLAGTIAAGLDATETKTATFEGKITDTLDLVNWGERRASAELAARLMGYLDAPGKPGPESSGVTLNVNFGEVVNIKGES